MYDRRLSDGRTLSFGHAGILIGNSFVFYDRQTESYWVQVTGEAYAGPLTGRRLRLVPATVTTWAAWRARFPAGTVLPGRRNTGLLGTYDGPLQTSRLGLAVRSLRAARLYPFAGLARQSVVNDTLAGQPIVVAYDAAAASAMAWLRTVGGRVLSFEPASAPPPGPDGPPGPLVRDVQTGSVWSALSGEALSGPLTGQVLQAVPNHPIVTERFRAFFPQAAVYGERP